MSFGRWIVSVGSLVTASLAFTALFASSCSEDALEQHGTPQVSSSASGACVSPGDTCEIVFEYPIGGEHAVELRGDFADGAWDTGVPLTIEAGEWQTKVTATDGATIHYKFFVDGKDYVADPNNPDQEDDGFGAKNSVKHVSCGDTKCPTQPMDPQPGVFDWRSAVLYFVFVDRFKNGDTSNDAPIANVETAANYQGGDYQGVIDELDAGYFDDLGVNALWLTVPMDNTSDIGAGADGHDYSAYHGYWPKNLDQVEEHFGDMTSLRTLVTKAHDRNIKVIFDYAMNQVHLSSPTYTQHPDWFWPLDYDGKHCVCGEDCAWDGYEGRRCWFRDYLPDWNYQNPDARSASIDNALFWVQQTGIDGFRLDAVKHIETVWISDLRTRVNQEVDQSKVPFYMVGETFETGNRDLIRQFVGPDLLDGQFDFPLRGAIVENILRRSGTFYDLDGFLATNDTYYPGVMSTFIGNHDIARVIQTALNQPWGAWDNGGTSNWTNQPSLPNYRAPFERLGLGFAFLLTTKGIPLIYYGDEIGMPGSGDPDNRRMMQFDGLSEDQAWLFDRIKQLGKIRKENPVLWRGTRTTVSVSNDTYCYSMSEGADVLYVAMNRGDLPGSVDNLPATTVDLLTGETVIGPSAILEPRSVRILKP